MDELIFASPGKGVENMDQVMEAADSRMEVWEKEGCLMMEFDMEREIRIRDVFLLLNQHIGERGDMNEQPIDVLHRIIAERDTMARII